MFISYGCSDFYYSDNDWLAYPSQLWNQPIRSYFTNQSNWLSTNQKPFHLHQVACSWVVIDKPIHAFRALQSLDYYGGIREFCRKYISWVILTTTQQYLIIKYFVNQCSIPKLFSIGTIVQDDTMSRRSLGMNGFSTVAHAGRVWLTPSSAWTGLELYIANQITGGSTTL